MAELVTFFLRTTVILGAALAIRVALSHRSAAARHSVLAAGVAAALAVTPLAWIAPAWDALAVPVPAWPAAAAGLPPATVPTEPVVTIAMPGAALPVARAATLSLWMLWLAGVALVGVHRLASLVRLAHLGRHAEEAPRQWHEAAAAIADQLGLGRVPTVRIIPPLAVPVTWGWRRPTVLLPIAAREWTSTRMRIVLLHELAHVRRGDWAVQMLAETLCALCWCHPLAWMVRARLRADSERACDDVVLMKGVAAHDYGSELLALAREQSPLTVPSVAVSMARTSMLEGRVAAMLNTRLDRRPVTRRTTAIVGIAVIAVSLPLAGLRLAAQVAPRPLELQVFDASGGALPGVAVTLEDKASGTEISTTTEGIGRARMDGVAPGDYALNATLPGFRPLSVAVTLQAPRDWTRSLTLQVGELRETIDVRERRPQGRAAARASAVIEPPRVGGNIRVPKKLKHVSPDYPPAMREAGLEGVVPMEALIGRDGTVASVRVLSADVHPDFAQAAERAVSQWLFSPTLLNGEAIEVRMHVSMRFSLSD